MISAAIADQREANQYHFPIKLDDGMVMELPPEGQNSLVLVRQGFGRTQVYYADNQLVVCVRNESMQTVRRINIENTRLVAGAALDTPEPSPEFNEHMLQELLDLRERVRQVHEYNDLRNARELAPDGDSYNDLLDIIGA
jgi:hypothetical protein